MEKVINKLWIQQIDGNYRIGMTDELLDEAGEISYANLTTSDTVEVDETLIELEASKAVLEIVSPLKGRIKARNLHAEDMPSSLNSSNKANNWLVELTDVDESAFKQL